MTALEPLDTRTPQRLAGHDLVLGFGRTEVVHGVSIELVPGRVTALVGPNGSGKSTLLRTLARLHSPESGGVSIGSGERDALSMSPREFAREVTLFAQTRSAPSGLSVREVVEFGRHPYRKRFAGLSPADHAAVDRALDITGVSAMAERSAGELSGGELQRVWLACCLAQETGIVLLDEPTNHLDLRYQTETLDLIRDLAEDYGVAVGVVLHDLDHAARVADDVVLLHAGRILAAGPALDVLTATNISTAYDLRVDVHLDESTGHLRIDPVSRHDLRVTEHHQSEGNTR
ncbi:ABC transporter ATP-binding protein [Brevibacterium sp. 91QC2O2]|uniref:ABC transporter ATP-binding protein n=1 Tax=Brevibacterium TaxID=1696 RepID=UPI00211BC640|nr:MULTISPECIES: ABC transporter ATP-binding protein [unclassified Brevibacterium]MCQ9367911.1 ABC transporter ATP-binding protein [Brevibacterium sp. 91QC2O2]MCQ9386363.1 ABC transporter ATP-binding protein [Brevibacterium sp. 68QC2CO]